MSSWKNVFPYLVFYLDETPCRPLKQFSKILESTNLGRQLTAWWIHFHEARRVPMYGIRTGLHRPHEGDVMRIICTVWAFRLHGSLVVMAVSDGEDVQWIYNVGFICGILFCYVGWNSKRLTCFLTKTAYPALRLKIMYQHQLTCMYDISFPCMTSALHWMQKFLIVLV